MRRLLPSLLLLLSVSIALGWYYLHGGEKTKIVLRCDDCDATVASADKEAMVQRLEHCEARSIDLEEEGDRLVVSFRAPRTPHDWKGILSTKGRFRIAELVRGRDLPDAVARIRERIGSRADEHPDVPGMDTMFASAMLVPKQNLHQADRVIDDMGFTRLLQGRAEPMWSAAPGDFSNNGTPTEGHDLFFVSTSTPVERQVGNAQIAKARFEPAHGTYVDLIDLELTPEGSAALGSLVDANLKRFLANVLDDRVLSAAMVVGPISTSSYSLVGCGAECALLADILTTPPLTGTWRIEQ